MLELTCNFPSSSCARRFPWKPLISVLEVKASSGVCGSLKAAGLDLPLLFAPVLQEQQGWESWGMT